MSNILEMGKRAKQASAVLAGVSSEVKNKALDLIAKAIISHADDITAANAIDVDKAKAEGMTDAFVDRLVLTDSRIRAMANGAMEVVALPDPIGEVLGGGIRPNGLRIQKVRVPLGVIAIIYESRPNVTVDAAVLCLKSGNAVILRGGKEAVNSGAVLANIMRDAVAEAGLPRDCIQFVTDTSRESAAELMKLSEYVDVLIPRGGAGLISATVQNATVPVIETGVGNCHMYVDKDAKLEMAVSVVNNAKTSRPSVCNAIETLLIHSDVAESYLPKIKQRLDESNVELRGCSSTIKILGDSVKPVTEQDFETEFSDYIMAVRIVDSVDEAIEHIRKYTTGHSEAIITENFSTAQKFTAVVDATSVYVNASTRYTDGGEFGLGAEIGISTQKLHARGPMGLEALTSIKFIIHGDGQIRE